jgi:hypothetical protein
MNLYVYVPILDCRVDEMSVPARILDAMTKISMPDLSGLDRFITRAELFQAGFTRAGIASLVDSGELLSLSRGVYVATGAS